MAMYIRNPSGHFDVVLSVSDPPQSEYKKEYSRALYKDNPDPKNQSKFDTPCLYVWLYMAGHSVQTMLLLIIASVAHLTNRFSHHISN